MKTPAELREQVATLLARASSHEVSDIRKAIIIQQANVYRKLANDVENSQRGNRL